MLSVGAVFLPVKLYKACDDNDKETAKNEIHDACKGPVSRKSWCYKCDLEVAAVNVLKGVPDGNGGHIILTKEELDSISPESSKNILIDAFVPLKDIDPLYVETSYYIAPDGAAVGAGYAAMVWGLMSEKKAAQGRLTIYNREHTVTIRAVGTTLVCQLMRTATQVRDAAELPGYIAPNAMPIAPEMKKLFVQVMNIYPGNFDATDYEDEYVNEFKALVESKRAGTLTVAAKGKKVALKATDLMAALKASLDTKQVSAKKVDTKAVAKGPVNTKGKATKSKATKVTDSVMGGEHHAV
jgi:DNA end-binding protein Ku